ASHTASAAEGPRAERAAAASARRRESHRTSRRSLAREPAARRSSASREARHVGRHVATGSERDRSQSGRRLDRGAQHEAASPRHGLHAGRLGTEALAEIDAQERESREERKQARASPAREDARAEGPRDARPRAAVSVTSPSKSSR